MDSPTPSEADTFVDNTTSMCTKHSANAPLMEEFNIDPNPVTDTASYSTPPLFTPAHIRAYNFVTASRIAIFFLNFMAVLIPIFGLSDPFDSALLPITVITSSFNIILIMVPMILHVAYKSNLKRKAEARDQAARRRNAILVEDPVTGEERWMLEPKKTSDDDQMGRVGFAVFDVTVTLSFLVTIALFLYYGGTTPSSTLGWALSERILMLVLVAASGFTTFRLMGKARSDQSWKEMVMSR